MGSRTYRVNDNQDRPLSMALLREIDDFGFKTMELARPPSRFWGGRRQGGPVRNAVDVAQVTADQSFGDLLGVPSASETTMAQSRRAQAQLFAWFLLAEDPQRRLEARAVSTLAHQASLVRHVLTEGNLKSVLIADEVGLGKTVEAGLIIKELVDARPGLRVLYLAPAGLTRNVRNEMERLGLPFRLWVSGLDNTARLTDQMVLASIHRAVHPAHYDAFIASGPWDVIVVDECHHLSDWQKDGGKPTRKYRLVHELRSRLGTDSHLMMMSGTPHQGHPSRFENLLRLLQRGNEPRAALAGRVIYRTKEDVADWNGRPLFPRRDVRRPLVMDLGPAHRAWLEEIHRTFEMNRTGDGVASAGQARRRALGWRCGQALQWATSSIEAGLGFLVRQAIRARWTLAVPELRLAVEALRPYRRGPADEDPDALYHRIAREIGRQREDDSELEDIDADDPDEESQPTWRPDATELAHALGHGVALLREQGAARWDLLRREVLDPAGRDKVVLFAQPIETVTALAAYLERVDGIRPAMIIGGQTPDERAAEVAAFWRDDGPRFLVSSRAGGEGYNLQNSHVLVHLDVPWNPMELEQRVGRVHRFMSKRTIHVHTLVVKDSREVDMYDKAREKLRNVTRTMGQERFEELFARVMALVPPEELAEVLVRDALGPLSDQDQEELAALVTEGHRRWERFDNEFSAAQRSIRAVTPGQASWQDLQRFATDHLAARSVEGLSALRFGFEGGEVVEDSEAATVLEIEGALYACGDYASTPVTSPDGRPVAQLGLNLELVCSALRRFGLPEMTPGVAYLRWVPPPELDWLVSPIAVLAYGRANIAIEDNSYREGTLELSLHAVFPDGNIREVPRSLHGVIVRALQDATLRRDIEVSSDMVAAVRRADEHLFTMLRRPSELGLRHAVFPLVAVALV